MAGLRERKKQQTRDALVDAALSLFQKQGFAETTLDELCATVAVSKRTFFRYFAGKEDVVLAPSHELWSAFLREVESLPSSRRTVFVTLQEALLAALEKMDSPQWAERMAASRRLAETSPSITAHNLSFCDRISDETRQVLSTRLTPTGPADLRPRLAQDLLVAAFQAAVEQWAKQPGRQTRSGLRARLEDTLTAAAQVTSFTGDPVPGNGPADRL